MLLPQQQQPIPQAQQPQPHQPQPEQLQPQPQQPPQPQPQPQQPQLQPQHQPQPLQVVRRDRVMELFARKYSFFKFYKKFLFQFYLGSLIQFKKNIKNILNRSNIILKNFYQESYLEIKKSRIGIWALKLRMLAYFT